MGCSVTPCCRFQDRLAAPHMIEEEEGKFRCKECKKLFSAQRFVVKHVATKHPEHIDGDKLDDVAYLNNYVLDPAKPHDPVVEDAAAGPRSDRRGASGVGRPLSDRIDRGGMPPAKRRRGDYEQRSGPPPPPPAGAALDPRARRGARDYADLDGAPQGAADVTELPY